MSDHDLPPEHSAGDLATQLARLEHMLAEQAARMHVIERQLGIGRAAPAPRPFGQGATPASPSARPTQTNGQREAVSPPPFSVTDAPTEQTARPTAAPPSITAAEHATTDTHEATSNEPAAGYAPAWQTHATQHAGPARGGRAARGPQATAGARANGPAAAGGTKAWGDLETLIAGKLFLWLGMITGTLAVSFFLKLAFDNQWIGPTGRVLLGGAAGCALLALAERLRLRGYQAYAYVLSGGGILILYLSVYASFSFYHLLGQPPAFALMAIVTATAVLLAARYDAYAIAVLGLIGGFMTPSLLSTNVDNEVGLFGYVALLNAGVLALAYFKRWRSLNYLAFAATWLLFAGWGLKYYGDAKLWPTLFFLTLFFVMFAALAIIHNVLKQRPARWFDISLLLTNATLYFATSYALLEDHQRLTAAMLRWQGPHALLLAGFFGLLYFIARQRHRTDRLLTYSYVAAAVTFLTMAVAIQLDQLWVTIGWAVEALMLTWVGLRAEEDAPRFAALPVFTVAVLHWFSVDMPEYGYHVGTTFWPLLNKRAVSCAVLVGVCAGVTWLYRRYSERVNDDDRDILRNLFALAGSALALALLTVDLNDYFSQRIAQVTASLPAVGSMLANTQQLALSVLWTLYGTAAFIIGLRLRRAAVRYGALVLLTVAGAKILLVDATYYNAPWHALLFNQTAAAFALFIAALYVVAHLYARADETIAPEAARVVSVVTIIGHVFALIALSLETTGYFAAQRGGAAMAVGQLRDLRLARELSLSVLWAVYGGALLGYGFVRHNRLLRVLALALLGLTTCKVFFFDLASLDKAYRIVSFIVLGAILLAVSFLYQQRQQRAARAEAD